MNNKDGIYKKRVEKLFHKLNNEAESFGYNLNPDKDFTMELIKGLIINEDRYGYPACPCRLASGNKSEDVDIICPCDYRDPDLSEYDTCYCSLYVSKNIINGKKELTSIPERRSPDFEKPKNKYFNKKSLIIPIPIWRCKVCGYLCARDIPPEICPICKATKDRFEKFIA